MDKADVTNGIKAVPSFQSTVRDIVGPATWRRLLLAAVLFTITALIETLSIVAAIPILAGRVVNTPLGNFGTDGISSTMIIAFLLVYSFGLFLRAWTIILSNRMVMEEGFALCGRMFSGILAQSYEWHLARSYTDLLANVLSDSVDFLSNVLLPMVRLLSQGILLLCLCLFLLLLQPIITTIIVLTFGIACFVIIKIRQPHLASTGKKQVEFYHERYRIAAEALDCIREIKMSGFERPISEEFVQICRGLGVVSSRVNTMRDLTRVYLEFVFLLLVVAGVTALNQFSETASSDMTLYLAVLAIASFKLIPNGYAMLSSFISLQNSSEILHRMSRANWNFDPKANQKPAPQFLKTVVFQEISFRYPNCEHDVFTKFSINIRKGKNVAILGQSGSGKSTLVSLLCGLLSPTSGQILIDNQPLTAENREQWLREIQFCAQNPIALNMSVAENIRFGRNIAPEVIRFAARLVQIDDVLDSQPRLRGKAFSGGQLQKIGLARAIVQPGEICILDEPSNNLGDAAALEILRSIISNSPSTTYLVVTHNPKVAALLDETISLAHVKFNSAYI
jgi:ABC-type bacteriocin/lantibiotic exporter with double-glycine peptidase domain